MATRVCQDSETACARPGCGLQILPGTEMVSRDAGDGAGAWMHPECYQSENSPRGRETPWQVFQAVNPQLTGTGAMNITAGRLRVLVNFLLEICPELEPARRADAGKPGQLYRRMPGWLREHVNKGPMTPQEWAGFWLDHLDVGRCPIIRRDALREVLGFTEERTGEYLVWTGWPLSEVRPGHRLVSWSPEHQSAMLRRAEVRLAAAAPAG